MSDALALIERYTELAIAQFRGELGVDARQDFLNLEDALRDAIEGCRPAPRRTMGSPSVPPNAAGRTSAAAPAPPRARPERPRAAEPARPAPARHDGPSRPPRPEPAAPKAEVAAPKPAPKLSAKDSKKVKAISVDELPKSEYAPRPLPSYLKDYFGALVETEPVIPTPSLRARAVVNADGESVDLPNEVKIFYGVTERPRPRVPAPEVEPTPREEAPRPARDGDDGAPRLRPAPPRPRPASTALPDPDTLSGPPPPRLRREKTEELALPDPELALGDPEPDGLGPETPPLLMLSLDDALPPGASQPPPPLIAAPEPDLPLEEPVEAPSTLPPDPVPVDDLQLQAPMARPEAIAHLNGGAVVRGKLIELSPDRDRLVLEGADGEPSEMALAPVIALFVAAIPGEPSAPATGQALIVTLQNDRRITGRSPDYAPGVPSIRLYPEQRGKVDYVWIPAWGVKEVRLG